jgi:DNA-binding NarL/FixJ family response regulator
MRLTVLVADASGDIAEQLRAPDCRGWIEVEEARTYGAALAAAAQLGIDVAIVDAHLDGGGLELAQHLIRRIPTLPVMLVSELDHPPDLAEAVRAGALACLDRATLTRQLPTVVQVLSTGLVVLRRDDVRRLAAGAEATPSPAMLRERDTEILNLVLDGWDTGSIASRLGVSELTARRRVAAARNVARAVDTAQAERLRESLED